MLGFGTIVLLWVWFSVWAWWVILLSLDFLGLCGFMLDDGLRGGFGVFGDLLVLVFGCCDWFGYRFWLVMLVVLVWLCFSLVCWCDIVLDETAGCQRVLDVDTGLLWRVFWVFGLMLVLVGGLGLVCWGEWCFGFDCTFAVFDWFGGYVCGWLEVILVSVGCWGGFGWVFLVCGLVRCRLLVVVGYRGFWRFAPGLLWCGF